MKVIPLNDKILVKRLEAEDKTAGGILLPDTAKEKPRQGKVLSLGDGKLLDDGKRAAFQVKEENDHYRIALDSDDGKTHLLVDGHLAQEVPAKSIFGSLKEASDFFERGALGYSVTAKPGQFDGLELHSFNWQVEPLAVDKVESSFFEDAARFPPGSVEFDCALLMRGIDHEWHGKGRLCA